MPFTLVEERFVAEIASTVRYYRHNATGARLLSLVNADENKVFGVTFRTPPFRSDGVAHILEHSVLCGSEKYPLKEPFIELVKGSLNTFLNAFTFPDKTVYPLASTNVKDFYNLIDVYLDAVFHPKLSEDTFRQEGWHYEADDATGSLFYKGVVFNEMKGNYSDPDDLHSDLCRRSLFPDTAYGLDSGGDPLVIPQLSYGEFKAFHKKYYHPSNSFIYFYGDDDPGRRLELIDRWLAPYSRIEVESLPGLQTPFEAPRRSEAHYEGREPKAWTAVNWALGEQTSHKTSLGLSVLSHILIATPASPLRKALIDSGLGEDLAGFGLEGELRTGAWSVGLKGVEPSRVGAVENLIFSELRRLSSEGIDLNTVEASLNTVEFALREKNTGRFPRGLAILLEALGDWLYDRDPVEALAFEAAFAEVKKEAAQGAYFENLIRRYFLDNPHRSTVTVLPDPEAGARREAVEKQQLAEARASMSQAGLDAVAAAARRLHELQDVPDSPEALASIPSLTMADLSRESLKIPTEKTNFAAAELLFHDLPTSGILYLDLAFPLRRLQDSLLPYVGLLDRALLEMGTDQADYVTISQEIGKHTGGIGASAFFSTKWKGSEAVAYFIVRGKALAEKATMLFKLLEEILLEARLDNKDRFRQIVLEEKAQAEASLLPSGHRVVALRLLSRLTAADRMSEQVNGLEQLFFLRELAKRIDSDWPGVLADLQAVRKALLGAGGLIVNATMDRVAFEPLKPSLKALVNALRAQADGSAVKGAAGAVAGGSSPLSAAPLETAPIGGAPALELLSAPTQVNFVGRAYPLAAAGAALSGAFLVAKQYLDTTFLWEKVRVQGGAYGGLSTYSINSGVFTLLSYRDPNLQKTLDIFARAADYLAAVEIGGAELTRAVIGTIGNVDRYLLPDARGFTALVHYLTGYSYEERQIMRDQILATGPEDFKALAAALAAAQALSIACALASAQTIEALPSAFRENAERKTVI